MPPRPLSSGLPAASGTVTVGSNLDPATCQIVLPMTSCDLTLSAVGIHGVRASYAGDGNYAPAEVQLNHRVVAPGTLFLDGFETN